MHMLPGFFTGADVPTPRVIMRKIRQALQLLPDSGLSSRQVAAALRISKLCLSQSVLAAAKT